MKQPLTFVITLVAVGSSSAALAGTTRDHRDSGTSSNSGSSNASSHGGSLGPVVRDHRDSSPAPAVRDHRTSEPAPTGSSTPTVTDHRSTSPTYEPQDQSSNYLASTWGGNNAEGSTGPKINWTRARFEVETFVRRVSAVDSTAGFGLQLTGDITRNLYVGIEVASGAPLSDEMNTNAMFRQAGVVAGVRGVLLPRFTIGAEGALGIQEFRDVTTVVDLRVKAEQQLASNISLGIYGGRNVNADRDVFAGMNLVFHSAR
ncbi:MAG: hypothetical protein KBG15_23085 [Kofleriaceae bacterium]|nr:hypothetical protein [Kofleriaceae bacterium]